MAEGLLRDLAGDRFDVRSAGTEPKDEVHPYAVQAMKEVGIDISGQRPKHLDEFGENFPIQHLMIVCDSANERCPVARPGMQHRHYWPFDDPAAFAGSDAETKQEFRRVRDQIRHRFLEWLQTA